MVALFKAFGHLVPRRILVVGDLLLDSYTLGQTRRVSPEAPVVVVQVTREEQRPGGAGNVMLNLISLKAEVVALGRVGTDRAGQVLRQALDHEGVNTDHLLEQASFATPVKNRIIAAGQQIVRVDYEQYTPLSPELEAEWLRRLPALLSEVEAVAISDYGKGGLSPSLLQALISQARSYGLPVVVDPKGADFARYQGASMIKPNLREAYAAAGCDLKESLEEVAGKLLERVAVDVLMITRSEEGISLYYPGGASEHHPVKMLEVRDVTGAGDTVLAHLVFGLANGLAYGEATQLANVAAGIAIEHFGCARVTLPELAERLLAQESNLKIFAAEPLYPLQQILQLQPFVLLSISLENGLTAALLQAIQTLTIDKKITLVLYICDENPVWMLVQTLAALHYVNYVLVSAECLQSLCSKMAPQAVYMYDEENVLVEVEEWTSVVNLVGS